MVMLNLFPWRAQQQLHRVKFAKNSSYAVLIVAILCVLCMHFGATALLQRERNRVMQLQYKQKKLADKQQQFEAMLQGQINLSIIKKALQANAILQKLIIEIAKTAPNNFCFTEIERKDNNFYFTGNAASPVAVTEFLKSWPAANLFSEMKVEQLTQLNNQTLRFRFSAF